MALALLMLLLLMVGSGKAEPENVNGTLDVVGEEPTNETLPTDETLPTNETVPTSETLPTSEAPATEMEESPEYRAGSLSALCPCDLQPDFCDLNCCCDSSCLDCSVLGPECPFTFCLPGSTKAVSQMCLEKSFIFRNNTPYRTEILPGPDGCVLLFCVQLNDSKLNYLQKPQMVTKANFPALSMQYGGGPSFLPPQQVQPSSSAFYRVGDPVQTYFAASSVLSVLKQPAGMLASQLCTDENPAGFLESKSTSCIRIFTDLASSCTTDPALDAASYYRDFSVLKVPVNLTVSQPLQVNITPVSTPASPSLNGHTCHDVVSEVIYEVEFNGIHGIQNVSVQFKVTNISGNPGATLHQRFSLHFWSRGQSSIKQRSGNPGYIMGAPLIALYNNTQQHVSILQGQGNGQCSATERYKVRFGENVMTDCQLSIRLKEANCSHLQEMLYQAFQGPHTPESLAITGNADPGHPGEWSNIFFNQTCNKDVYCMVPFSLKIQVIWAQVGLLSNPQAQVLGARYQYLCKPLMSLGSDMNVYSLITTVDFTDVTKRPEPPRGRPRIYWKLPFDFFFPFKVALSGTVSSSGNTAGTLLVTLTLCGAFVS